MSAKQGGYFLPEPSFWPLFGSITVSCILIGLINWLHGSSVGPYFFFSGFVLLTILLFGWFGKVVNENQAGVYNNQVDRSFRLGMGWFIFTEVCFFATFFGALFYTRLVVIPQLGGDLGGLTHYLVWPDFKAVWPLLANPSNKQFIGPEAVMNPWHLPALNTLLLLTSGVTITWAHWALRANRRKQLVVSMMFTIALGIVFLAFQAMEYAEAYEHYGLTLHSGIYGSTFFMLTGFHGLHVTIGTLMLIVILGRCLRGHFTPDNHFAFEGVAWYWHFVDVVWLFLFIFVYWL